MGSGLVYVYRAVGGSLRENELGLNERMLRG
jgi:hypothetical protein